MSTSLVADKALARSQPMPPLTLRAFRRDDASRVGSWVRSARELFWLAPRTPPPLTEQVIVGWGRDDHRQFCLAGSNGGPAVAYGEVNLLAATARQYWLGHIVVDPQYRGHRLGVELTRRLLRQAFHRFGAQRVVLVVFPDNQPAVRCYAAAGLQPVRYEQQYFAENRRREWLLRMEIARDSGIVPDRRAGSRRPVAAIRI
ncbi:MAG: hypothetical protein CHACPFDD_02126 [Phycisphaerae bacterium]|nr:hypothetical protein [Phycisphaerae bacterium]